MKEIYINGRFLTQRRSGMQRWAEEVLTALDELISRDNLKDLSITVLVPSAEHRIPNWTNIKIERCGRFSGHMWEQLELPAFAKGKLLLNLLSTGPVFHGRQIVTLHDANVFRNPHLFSIGYRILHCILRPILARKSELIFTVSRFSARELSEILVLPPNKFSVLPNAADHFLRIDSDQAALDKLNVEPQKYGLCVGNQSPNKNIKAAIKAFREAAIPGTKLILVGAGNATVFGKIDLSYSNDVLHAGYLSDSELKGLYQSAAFLCFPSRYEGFGVPVLEAMQLGCPVIASNTAAIPEVAGNAAILCNPEDISAMSEAMSKLFLSSEARDNLSKLGLERSLRYSWKDTAKQLLAVHANM